MGDESELMREMSDWWATEISDIGPGRINLRGVAISDLMVNWDFVSVIMMMLSGRRPSEDEAILLNAALIASVDHGPQAPSIAAARMAASCGVGLNNAVATGVNLLGDTHGGAGQQCLEILYEIDALHSSGGSLSSSVQTVVERWRSVNRFIPGFGHRFHAIDPRRAPMLELLMQARDRGSISGRFIDTVLAIEEYLSVGRTKSIWMNIDGATAVVYAELGLPAPLARGLFVLGRSVGILAHAWEEMSSGSRIKGPMPKSVLPTYLGANP